MFTFDFLYKVILDVTYHGSNVNDVFLMDLFKETHMILNTYFSEYSFSDVALFVFEWFLFQFIVHIRFTYDFLAPYNSYLVVNYASSTTKFRFFFDFVQYLVERYGEQPAYYTLV